MDAFVLYTEGTGTFSHLAQCPNCKWKSQQQQWALHARMAAGSVPSALRADGGALLAHSISSLTSSTAQLCPNSWSPLTAMQKSIYPPELRDVFQKAFALLFQIAQLILTHTREGAQA